MIKKISAIIVLVILLSTFNVFAVDTYSGYNYPIDIDVNGSFIKCAEKPILMDGTTYIPLRDFSDAVGGTIEWNGEEMSATMLKDGHTFVFYLENDYCLIDGDQKNYGSVVYNGLTFVPVRAVSEVLGYEVSWDDFYLAVKIVAPGVEVPWECIDTSYTYEDIMYLAKITQIESGYQHFQVKLGVAGTVMNRVKSPEFPATVKDVIFDTRYSPQFPPAHTEKFETLTVSKDTMIASKCVLFGVNIVEDSLYFVDTAYAPGSWVHTNRPHCITLHDMSFYR